MNTKEMTKLELIQYAKLRQKKSTATMAAKMTEEERKVYLEVARIKEVSPSELIRQGLYKSLYHFRGIMHHKDDQQFLKTTKQNKNG